MNKRSKIIMSAVMLIAAVFTAYVVYTDYLSPQAREIRECQQLEPELPAHITKNFCTCTVEMPDQILGTCTERLKRELGRA